MFKVGEIVVYPRQGAGKVVARERKHILGEDHEYLTIKIFQSELTMLVRCDGVEAAGIARSSPSRRCRRSSKSSPATSASRTPTGTAASARTRSSSSRATRASSPA